VLEESSDLISSIHRHVEEVIAYFLSLTVKRESLDCNCLLECDKMVLNGRWELGRHILTVYH
jgi:hypothetical protein